MPLGHHPGVGGGDPVGDASEVHVEDVVERLGCEEMCLAAEGDPGVVEQQVEPSVLLGDGADELVERDPVTDIEQYLAAGDVGRDDRGPSRAELVGEGGSDA
jgi:hypothetical protein